MKNNMETIYRNRLAIETDLATESVFHEMDASAKKAEKRELKKLKVACADEKEYISWKENFLETEYQKMNDQKFLVCSYLFAGIGQYEMVIPGEQLPCFEEWIMSCGSAFMCGNRDASEEDVKIYIALNAMSD